MDTLHIADSPTDFQRIFDAVPGLFLVLAPDSPRFTILAATDAYLLATLKRRGEIIGRALFDVFPDNPGAPGVKAAQSTRASLERAIDLGVPDTMALQRYDIARPQSNGGGFEERHWRPVNSPVMNAYGEVAYLIHRVEDVTGFVQIQQQVSQQLAAANNLRNREGEAEALRDANRSLRDSRLATFNLMQDAVTARQQAERSVVNLKASEQRLRLATDATELGIWTWQSDGDWITWENELPYGILGMARTDAPLTATRFAAEFVHAKDLATFKNALEDTVKNGARLAYQGRFHCPDGQLRWIEFTGQAMEGVAGTSPGAIGTVRNITARKQAEQALRDSEERYRNLFNSIDEGFCIIEIIFDNCEKPVDYRFLEVNPSFEKQSGMQDVVGKRVREIIPDLEDHRCDVYGEVALTGVPVRFISEVKALDRWLDIRAVRLGGMENRQVAVIFDNVTERMQTDEALRHSEQRFRALFDSGPVAMYSCDTSGAILEFNPCAVKLWGREPTSEDTGGGICRVSKIYHLDGSLLTAAQNPVSAVLKGEIPQANDVEVVVERPDGSRITVIANIVPLKNSRGEITGAITCFYDITERSRLERKTQDQAQALAELHRRKDEFLAMLSHELRNPLAPLTSAVELLRLQPNQNPAYQHTCQVIERQVGQMKHLVDDLLEVSRITSGNVRLRKEPVRVGDIVERALETVQPLILKRQHQLTVSLPPRPVWLDADATRLEQVLVNLLNNAAKYTDAGGRLWLSVGQEGDAASKPGELVAVITVRDAGMGIAPELLPHVFDLFTQAERAIDRSQGGMGVGLCLVRQLVELHGGSVEAHSILGQGSEFVVRLPVMPAAVPPVSLPPPLSDPVRPTARSCRVLAVDDSVDAVEFMAKLLRLSGHEVEVAYDGPGVLEAALAMRPDVVLLDIGLPGLTGYEVARQLRQEPSLKNTVLVALTGYGRESDRQRSKNAGFGYHLVKPVGVSDVQEILATIGEQLALHSRAAQPVKPEV